MGLGEIVYRTIMTILALAMLVCVIYQAYLYCGILFLKWQLKRDLKKAVNDFNKKFGKQIKK